MIAVFRRIPARTRRQLRLALSYTFIAACLAVLRGEACGTGAEVSSSTDLLVTPTSVMLTVGDTQEVLATPINKLGKPDPLRDVTWTSSNSDVVTVTPKGKQAAILRAVGVGAAVVTASLGPRDFIKEVSVQVAQATLPVARVEIAPSTLTMRVADTLPMAAQAFDAGGVALGGRPYTWSITNTAVATLDGTGSVVRIIARSVGTTPITVTSGGIVAAGTISVTQTQAPATVRASQDTTRVAVGASASVTLTAHDRAGAALPDSSFGVAIADASIARFTTPTTSANGRTALAITGVKAGTTSLIATIGTISVSFPVVVSPAPVDSVRVTPRTLSLVLNGSGTVAAKVYAGGAEATGRTIGWSSTDGAVATVAASGASATVTGRAAGSAAIVASVDGKADTVRVTVAAVTGTAVPIQPIDTRSVKRLGTGGTQVINGQLDAGDSEGSGDKSVQGFATYLYDAIPAGATIVRATVTVTFAATGSMGAPFALGGLVAERTNGFVLNEGNVGADAVPVATSATPATVTIDVTEFARAAYTRNEGSLGLRFRMAQLGNANGASDTVRFTAAPLTVTYTTP